MTTNQPLISTKNKTHPQAFIKLKYQLITKEEYTIPDCFLEAGAWFFSVGWAQGLGHGGHVFTIRLQSHAEIYAVLNISESFKG